MEEKSATQVAAQQGALKDIQGKWVLKYSPSNTQGPDAFGGITLTPYENPLTGELVHLRAPGKNKVLQWFIVSKIRMEFEPTKNIRDRYFIEWALLNPEITIEGYDDLPEVWKNAKNSNNRLKLVALDYQETKDILDEDYIDKLVGVLSQDSGTQAISYEKLQYILAELNVSYKDVRDISAGNRKMQKLFLRNKLKRIAKSSLKNAQQIYAIIDNIDNARVTYEIKEMIAHNILVESNGMFKYEGVPLGISVEGIKAKWAENPDLRIQMIQEVEKKLRALSAK